MRSPRTQLLLSLFNDVEIIFSRQSLQKKMFRLGGGQPRSYQRYLNDLQDRKIIRSTNKQDDQWHFTQKGKKWWQKSRRLYLVRRDQPWDGKWRVIIFDIPELLHNQRVSLRRRMKRFGFYQLQKSVFVFPYDCSVELAILTEDLKIGEYVDVILAEQVGFQDKEVRRFFNL